MESRYRFQIHIGDDIQIFTERELEKFASSIGLDRVAPAQYSWLFVMQLVLYVRVYNVDLSMIIAELNALEGGQQTVGTKPASRFRKEPLKGLWHKHFFSTHFIPCNLRNQLAGGNLQALVERVLDPGKHPNVTTRLINELCHGVVTTTFEEREAQGKLTGEWIVFAKHGGQNYYLGLFTHNTEDQVIYDQIKSICFDQFPFLKPHLQRG